MLESGLNIIIIHGALAHSPALGPAPVLVHLEGGCPVWPATLESVQQTYRLQVLQANTGSGVQQLHIGQSWLFHSPGELKPSTW